MPRVRFEYSEFWWGQVLWIVYHRLCALYPQEPTPFLQRAMITFVSCLDTLLPCATCRENFPKELATADMPLETAVQSRDTLVQWFLDRHNAVNIRLGKQPWSAAQLYNSMEDICPPSNTASEHHGQVDWSRCVMPPDTARSEIADSEVFYIMLAVIAGLTPEGPLPTATKQAFVDWFTALYWVLRACDPTTGDVLARALLVQARRLDLQRDLNLAAVNLEPGSDIVLEPQDIAAALVHDQDSALDFLVGLWNEARRLVGGDAAKPVEKSMLVEEYCLYSHCRVSDEEHPEASFETREPTAGSTNVLPRKTTAGMHGHRGRPFPHAATAPGASIPSALPDPASATKVIAGERRWSQAMVLYIVLMFSSLALIIGVIVWLTCLKPSAPSPYADKTPVIVPLK